MGEAWHADHRAGARTAARGRQRRADSKSSRPLKLDGPPFVTCKAWAISDGETGELLWSHNAPDERLHPASTTKIMTGYLVAKLAEEDPSILEEIVTFTRNADSTVGSTSGVKAGEQLPVE